MAIKTITVQGDPIVREYLANEAITPGDLVEFVPNQTDSKLRKHGTDEGAAIPRFALENHVVGDGIEEAYASGELVRIATYRQGDVVLARVKANTAVQAGDKLGSNADGTLDVVDLTSAAVVEGAFVGEALDNVAASAGVKRVRVEVA